MTQQDIVNYINNMSLGMRITWDQIKYDADAAIDKINDHLGANYPYMSMILTAPHSTYSVVVRNKVIPIFPTRYIRSVVIPHIASEILARDEEFTTIYNKYILEVENGLFAMFQNEFNKVPLEFRQDKDDGVFFAVDHPLHKLTLEKEKNLPSIKFNIHYHVNNPNAMLTTRFTQDTNIYSYNTETTVLPISEDNVLDTVDAYYYKFKGWATTPGSPVPYEHMYQSGNIITLTSDVHLYARWERCNILEYSSNTFSINETIAPKLRILRIPNYVGSNEVNTIKGSMFDKCVNLRSVILPSVHGLTISTGAFNKFKGTVTFPMYDYLRNKPDIIIQSNAFTTECELPYVYLPYSVRTIAANAFQSTTYIQCEVSQEDKPNSWAENWQGYNEVEWGVSRG